MPLAIVSVTPSEPSNTASSIGVTVRVNVVTFAPSVSCRPFAESVPPTAVTV